MPSKLAVMKRNDSVELLNDTLNLSAIYGDNQLNRGLISNPVRRVPPSAISNTSLDLSAIMAKVNQGPQGGQQAVRNLIGNQKKQQSDCIIC